jgi:hypothetical protein
MTGRAAELAGVAVLATIITVAIAAPVLRAPSERIFGMDIVGRHHDPFTAMTLFEHPSSAGVYSQPVTDLAGAGLTRVTGPVAAYNWLVLLSFPLSAVAAYLLARHLALSRGAATFAALAFAFSPFHLAHAAYHPQVAETPWIPFYLFALWRLIDEASVARVALVVVATATVTLSNFYGGHIAAVITPVATGMYWAATRRTRPHPIRRLAVTVGTLVAIAAAGLTFAARNLAAHPTGLAFSRDDLFRYSATGWSYIVPPIAQPLLGNAARGFWRAAGVGDGLLEQQVYLGWSALALAVIATVGWIGSRRRDRAARTASYVPMLLVVAVTAFICSLSPEHTIGGITLAGPTAVFYTVAPMFRSYARFGVVVQLMVVLLSGLGLDALRRRGVRTARLAAMALVVIAVGEYSVAPAAMSRDVLPTQGHRWITRQAGPVRAFDCAPLDQESASVAWLSANRIALADRGEDCDEPHIADALAARGFTHLLVRRDPAAGRLDAPRVATDGLCEVARFEDSLVFAITAPRPSIYVETMTGFYPREYGPVSSWRWMRADAAWTIVNTTAGAIVVTLALDLSAFHRERRLDVQLDGRAVQSLEVAEARGMHSIGPFTVPPGRHQLGFHPVDPPTISRDVTGNRDPRALSLAINTWHWITQGDTP